MILPAAFREVCVLCSWSRVGLEGKPKHVIETGTFSKLREKLSMETSTVGR